MESFGSARPGLSCFSRLASSRSARIIHCHVRSSPRSRCRFAMQLRDATRSSPSGRPVLLSTISTNLARLVPLDGIHSIQRTTPICDPAMSRPGPLLPNLDKVPTRPLLIPIMNVWCATRYYYAYATRTTGRGRRMRV